jgi:hypothetical protein
MLKDIIESKYDSAVLTFFLIAPERAFSASELTRRLGISSNKLASSLSKFVKSGQIKSFAKRGTKYYILNSRHSEFAELKRALAKSTLKYTDELLIAIKKIGSVRAAFLTGVFTGNPELPVDLLLVGRVNLNKLAKFLLDCKKMMGQEINYSIMTEDEFKLRRDTFDRFIKDIFDYRHLVVVDNLTKKK